MTPRDGQPPTSYRELAEVLSTLSVLAREARRLRRLTLRAAADQMQVASATLHRVEHGDDASLSTAVRILLWLDRDAPAP